MPLEGYFWGKRPLSEAIRAAEYGLNGRRISIQSLQQDKSQFTVECVLVWDSSTILQFV
jgi:hypothetical protein